MVMKKKGFVVEMLAFVVIGIIAVLFLGGLIYGINLINGVTSDIKLDTPMVNISSASNKTIGSLNTGMGNLRLVALVMIVAYMLSTLIVAYFSSKHPIWIFVYLLITIMFVIFSVYISNSYETMKQNATIAQIVSGFSASEIIIQYLPYWVAFIGLVGMAVSIVGNIVAKRLSEV